MTEDIAQDALLAVWLKANRFDRSVGSVEAWIFTIARNLYVDRKRREGRRSASITDDSAPEPTAMDILVRRESEHGVRTALATIPLEQRRVIDLSFYEERTQQDIAITLNIPVGTVKSRSRLAVNRLRAAFQDRN